MNLLLLAMMHGHRLENPTQYGVCLLFSDTKDIWSQQIGLTHYPLVTCIYASIRQRLIDSSSPNYHLNWNNADLSLIGPLELNINRIWMKIEIAFLLKMHFKTSYAKYPPFCQGRWSNIGMHGNWVNYKLFRCKTRLKTRVGIYQ